MSLRALACPRIGRARVRVFGRVHPGTGSFVVYNTPGEQSSALTSPGDLVSVKSRESAVCSVVRPVRCETHVCRASGALVRVQINHHLPLPGVNRPLLSLC